MVFISFLLQELSAGIPALFRMHAITRLVHRQYIKLAQLYTFSTFVKSQGILRKSEITFDIYF